MSEILQNQFAAQLRQANLKVTSARLAILQILHGSKKPHTINQIKQSLGRIQIDLVTIYRNVENLEKLGIVKKVLINDEEAFYEYNQSHHHHLICKNCGKTEDFEQCNTKNLIKQILAESRQFGQVSEHSFELFGFCNTCVKLNN